MKLMLRTATDTATAQPVIPIFLIHTVQAPFCDQPSCWCQVSKTDIAPLLFSIGSGNMLLQEAAAFADGQAEGEKP